ncbi:hypothetical protein NMY22_g12396 [Coprinellus aureogranulatus]|nr:hypothetical protein NMY22_g12396 [Coprinellus aureogranulatus]
MPFRRSLGLFCLLAATASTTYSTLRLSSDTPAPALQSATATGDGGHQIGASQEPPSIPAFKATTLSASSPRASLDLTPDAYTYMTLV